MSCIPTDLWYTIAHYIPAQPIIFLRLATISSDLYQIFMSDEVWKRVDVYGVKKEISRHYIAEVYAASDEELNIKLQLFQGKYGEDRGLSDLVDNHWLAQRLYDSYSFYISSFERVCANGWELNEKTELTQKVLIESGNLETLSSDLWRDKELLMLAVSRRGCMLKDISENFEEFVDRDLVLAAVHNDGMALQYVKDSELLDEEVLLAAVFQNGLAVQHAPDFDTLEGPSAINIAITAIRNDLGSFFMLPQKVRQYTEVAAVAYSIGQKAAGIRNFMCSFNVVGDACKSRLL